ncbi:MAG: hypothetical protein ACYS14_00975 [Planctomycetota bacterium]|jgi:hypothetical protein
MVHVLPSVYLGATAGGCLAATGPHALSPRIDWLFSAYAIVSLILAVILLFWALRQHRLIEHGLSQKLADSVAAIDKLQQKNDELTAANEQLRQTTAESSAKLKDVPETVKGVTNTANPQTQSPGLAIS